MFRPSSKLIAHNWRIFKFLSWKLTAHYTYFFRTRSSRPRRAYFSATRPRKIATSGVLARHVTDFRVASQFRKNEGGGKKKKQQNNRPSSTKIIRSPPTARQLRTFQNVVVTWVRQEPVDECSAHLKCNLTACCRPSFCRGAFKVGQVRRRVDGTPMVKGKYRRASWFPVVAILIGWTDSLDESAQIFSNLVGRPSSRLNRL